MTAIDHRPTVEVDAETWEQTQADLASLRAQVQRTGIPADAAELEHLREQNRLLRDAANKAHRAEAENERLNRAITAVVSERDTARAELKEMGNELARLREDVHRLELDKEHLLVDVARGDDEREKLRRHLADAEYALVEANASRRLSNAEHLHQRLSAAALVIGRWRDWRYCPACRDVTEVKGARHACGPMVPVDVIIARRPRTEEQP